MRQYSWAADLFDRAHRRMSSFLQDGDAQGARRVVLELGHEALEENGLWLLLHRSRPAEAPTGG